MRKLIKSISISLGILMLSYMAINAIEVQNINYNNSNKIVIQTQKQIIKKIDPISEEER